MAPLLMPDITLTEGIVIAVIGLVSGAIGSLVAPWVNWGVEKRRIKREARAAKIAEWRSYVEMFDFDNEEFGGTSIYADMRPSLREDIVSIVESDTIFVGADYRGGNHIKYKIADEISRIERKWGLV